MSITESTYNLTIKTEPKVVIDTTLVISGYGNLPVNIVGDFSNIPEKYHQMFFELMISRYQTTEQ